MNYNGPGNINELSPELVALWQAERSEEFDVEIRKSIQFARQEIAWFYNPVGDSEGVPVDVTWNAFPKNISETSPGAAGWELSDSSRLRQDEYCEWEVVRDPASNKVTRVTFTTETFEFYEFLFQHNPQQLVDLYQQHVSETVTLDDLTIDGSYFHKNRWNAETPGSLMHMINRPNTLGAAVNLAANATWPSVDADGELITDDQALIRCRKFGDYGRHSDPTIGAAINSLVRRKEEVSLAGPLGLYIDKVDDAGLERPDGGDVAELWQVARGSDEWMMRIVFEAPAGSDFLLGDVLLDDEPVSYGGQLAQQLSIRIRAMSRRAAAVAPVVPCFDVLYELAASGGLEKTAAENLPSRNEI